MKLGRRANHLSVSTPDKHLLEAFQDIERRPAAAGARERREPVDLPDPSELRPPPDRRLWHELAACAVAFLLGVLTDRWVLNADREASAGAPGAGAQGSSEGSTGLASYEGVGNQGAGSQGVGSQGALSRPPYESPEAGRGLGPNPAPASGGSSARPADDPAAALFDPANEFVVQVITYGGSHADLAQATYEYLLEQGLPAFPPQRVRSNLVLLVGAAPSRAELVGVQDRVHRTLGPNGRSGEFSTAQIVRKSVLGLD